MHNRKTRSNKDLELVNLSNQELAELEWTNRKAKKSAVMVRTIIRPDEAGVLRDRDGQAYNKEGQKIDENGQVIPEPACGVARHQEGNGPDRNDRRAAAGALDRVMTLGDYNRPEQFYANRSANGVSSDYLFCKLFPYSLAGDAAYWLKQLKPGSLTTWEDTKIAFLNNFYDDARSEELRTKISSFSHGPTEAFKAACVRFKAYQKDFPRHGFSEVHLLGIFFRGVDWRYQMALDAASDGNFKAIYACRQKGV